MSDDRRQWLMLKICVSFLTVCLVLSRCMPVEQAQSGI